MAKQTFPESSYYPPRRKFWSPVKYIFYDLIETFAGWKFRIENGKLADKISILPLLIPGFGFFYAGKPRYGRLSLILYIIFSVFFFALLGFNEANYVLAFMIFLHSVNLLCYIAGLFISTSFRSRVLLSVSISTIIVPAIYYLFMNFLNSSVLIPIHYRDLVLVAVKHWNLKKLVPGDLIIFRQQNYSVSNPGIVFPGGLNIGKVIAREGERVVFTNRLAITKHGIFLKPVYYPSSMAITTAQNSVFVLTEMRIEGYFNEGIRRRMESIIVSQSMVGNNEIAGYIPKTWFGRRQYY